MTLGTSSVPSSVPADSSGFRPSEGEIENPSTGRLYSGRDKLDRDLGGYWQLGVASLDGSGRMAWRFMRQTCWSNDPNNPCRPPPNVGDAVMGGLAGVAMAVAGGFTGNPALIMGGISTAAGAIGGAIR